MLFRSDFDFFPAEEARHFVEKDRQVLAGRVVLDIPEEPIHTHHGLRHLHTKKIPILDDDGDPLYLLGISEDVTELKASGEALRARTEELETARALLVQNEQRLRVLLQHFPGVVWTTDARLLLRSVDGAGAQGLGLNARIGYSVGECLPAGPDDNVVTMHERARAGEPAGYEFRHDGRTWAARLERWEGGVIGLAVDVTERRRMEDERLRATLERTQRLETLGMLAGGIAHDFNNLLAAILGNASLASLRLPEGSPERADVDRVTLSAEAAANLTRQLLAYSGRGRFVVERVDISQVLAEVGEILRVSLSKKARLALDLAPNLPPCEVDTAQLRQVVLNLLTNANDALEDGPGTIRVSTGLQHADAAWFAGAWIDDHLPEGTYVRLEVSDSGCGMDPASMNRMFDPFFTTKPKGHGLGLAATLGIVRGHRGAIRVDSSPGNGTTITILLPPAVGSVAAPTAGRGKASGARRDALVLVVDDEEPIRQFVCGVLEKFGYRSLEAADGVEALEVFAARGAEIDAVLLDLTMPRLSGEETFRALRARGATMPVLLSSGYTEQDARSRVDAQGIAGFLQKPYRAATLVERLDELLS